MTSTWSKLYSYSAYVKKQINLAMFFSFTNKFFDIAPEILIGLAVDLVVYKDQSSLSYLGVNEPVSQLFVLGLLTFCIWALESLFQFLQGVKWKSVAQVIQHDLRVKAYEHMQNLNLSWFEKQRTGDLQTIINEDVNQLERFFNNEVNEIVQIAASTILIGCIFFYLSPSIAMGTIVPIPVILCIVSYFQKQLEPMYLGVRGKAGILASRLETCISGMPVIKSYVAEKWQLKLLEKDSRAYMDANAKAITMSSAFVPLVRFAVLLGFLLTLVYGGYKTLIGDFHVGAYSVMVFLSQRFLWPFTRLGQVVDNFSRAKAAATRVFAILETSSFAEHNGQKKEKVSGEITFTDLEFSYPETTKPSISQLNLKITDKQFVGIVGPTGSGKSTILKLLMRFYEPSSGSLCIGGKKIENVNLHSLRDSISYVSQDSPLFPGTVADNIAFGSEKDSRKMQNAAEFSESAEFIAELKDGFDTEVGERGQKLSGGQRQRLAIARAIYKDAPIMVFDEATSAVDNDTELAIQKSLMKIAHNKTMIVVAHRLSTIRHADHIYVVDKGQIRESGTHEELLTKTGIYHKLWQLQIGN
jgi:ATP-binding cassette subfamily B protein